jgi:hypothetical protein
MMIPASAGNTGCPCLEERLVDTRVFAGFVRDTKRLTVGDDRLDERDETG